MDLSSVGPNSTPPRFVNSQLVSLPPVGILNKNFCSICICICFIYTAPQACSFKYKPCINKVAFFFYITLIILFEQFWVFQKKKTVSRRLQQLSWNVIFIIDYFAKWAIFSIIIDFCVYSFWHKGPIRGKRCIQINVPTKPSNESWERSHLCWPHDGIYKFRWLTQRPSYEERDSCLEWTEPRDPTWKAKTYYLCANKVQQAIGMYGRDVKTVQNT